MVQDAEKFKAEDEVTRKKIEVGPTMLMPGRWVEVCVLGVGRVSTPKTIEVGALPQSHSRR